MKKSLIAAVLLGFAVPAILLAGEAPGTNRFLQTFDSNNDGKVTQEEIDKVKSDLFAKYDSDGNGVLSLEEWQALRLDRMKDRISQRFNRHDSNGDGAISLDEFMAQSRHMMDRMDENGDHMIDQSEMGNHHGRGNWGHHHGPQNGHCDNRG